MGKGKIAVLVAVLCLAKLTPVYAQHPKPPIIGWSSWNNFRVNISEQMIHEQADVMISSGLYAAGYRFINIDDGYFGGRDASGELFPNPDKFPSGMKALAAYIHSKGLKAGIYTDAGKNTCGSIWDKDSLGIGVGIYNNIKNDCHLFFNEWKYDFLKVDWCGGEKMKLDEQTAYTKIIVAVKSVNSNIVFNICRWQFPGEWAIQKADSWRISGDIRPAFSSILKIIDLNAELYKYASPGHYNDMDMLQVGRGMSYEEDKSHFTMWCIMNSPLLAGNDLRNMSKQTVAILTNKELIAVNQDIYDVQAKRVAKEKDVELWIKKVSGGRAKVITILNRSNETGTFTLTPQLVNGKSKNRLRDLWLHKEIGSLGNEKIFDLPGHSVVVVKLY